MLRTREEIEKWLIEVNIENYSINEDLTVDIDGDVDITCLGLEKIPVQFNEIKGSFNCSNNYLINLKGSPKKLSGGFYCEINKLISLEYCPEKINSDFYCSSNSLISLEYCPKEVKEYFNCSDNKLTSLEYCPKKIEGNFYCLGNELKKELLYLFNSNIKGDIESDFGGKEEFLKLVALSKNIKKEKEELNKVINLPENSQLTKKRL